MLDTPTRLLIVDDEPCIRTSLCQVFTAIGYSVRSASDGLLAMKEIHETVPEILISDLHMPNLSGFELLSRVRRRFPSIYVIAMSGAFTGNSVPVGVAADAFYEKASGLGLLLKQAKIGAVLTRSTLWAKHRSAENWIPSSVEAEFDQQGRKCEVL